VVVGGTAHALHKVLQGKRMTRQAAECVRNQLAREPHTLDFLDETRRRIFPDGLKILQDLMEFYHCAEVSFSSRGFLEGLWLAASLGQDGAL
jgi:exopolyphosphatase/pppGpp-phosphohydrolase